MTSSPRHTRSADRTGWSDRWWRATSGAASSATRRPTSRSTTTSPCPADGVYAGWLVRADGTSLPAAISVGTNPTFGGTVRRVEAYVLDRDDLELYGERVGVEFVERLRETITFDGVEPLVAQMALDVEQARRITAS